MSSRFIDLKGVHLQAADKFDSSAKSLALSSVTTISNFYFEHELWILYFPAEYEAGSIQIETFIGEEKSDSDFVVDPSDVEKEEEKEKEEEEEETD